MHTQLACDSTQACLQLLISHVFTKLFCYSFEVLEADLASFIIIKQPEGLENLLLQLQQSSMAVTSNRPKVAY